MITQDLAFVRTEEGTNTTVAILSLDLAEAEPDSQALERVRAAITDWVAQSKEGAAAWKESSQDFNIGDLAHRYKSKVLRKHLADHGIFGIRLVVADPPLGAIEYDAQLVNSDELPWD